MTISHNNNNKFPSRAYDLPSHRLLTRFMELGMKSLPFYMSSYPSWIGSPDGYHAIIAPAGTQGQAGWYCSRKDTALGETKFFLH